MKHKNETMPNGPAPRKTQERNKLNTGEPIIPVECALVGNAEVKATDAEDFRAQMHRRYTVPFVFTPWERGGLNE